MSPEDLRFLKQAIALGRRKMEEGCGGPFGALVVRNGQVVAEGWNAVTSDKDPTAHAEVQAIRNACRKLGAFQLEGCTIYSSCEPCPMCLGALYWARPAKVIFSASRYTAADAGFDDEFIYKELPLPLDKRQIPFAAHELPEALAAFEAWKAKADKVDY
jgi:guanine deaminase